MRPSALACANPGSLRCACLVVRRSACKLRRTELLSGDRAAMLTVIQLLDKRGFPHNHLPVLVVRQKPVKSRSGGCLDRSGDRKLTVVNRP